MKKVIVFISFLFIGIGANAQEMWLDIGIKGGYNSTWLLNRNYLNDKYVVTQIMGAPFGGLKLGFNITEKHTIAAEFLYTPINERFNGQGLDSGRSWTRDIKLNYFSIPILYKCSKNGSYVEIGPQFSFLNGASDSYVSTPSSGRDYNVADAKSYYQKNNISLAFGFGSYIAAINDNLYITIGFRGAYGLTDITGDKGGKGQKYTVLDPKNQNVTKSYQATNTLTLGFHLEMDFDFGYLVSAHCGRKQFLFFD